MLVSENSLEKLKVISESVSEIIKSTEELPQHAMLMPMNNYDYISLLLLIEGIVKCICDEDESVV